MINCIAEGIDKFVDALSNTVNHVKDELMPDIDFSQFVQDNHENGQEEAEITKSGIDTELKWD